MNPSAFVVDITLGGVALWVGLVVIAQALNAITAIIDKYVVGQGGVGKPIVYAFYVSGLSVAVLPIAFFGLVSWPSFFTVGISLVTALAYATSIFFLFSALRFAPPGDVVPIVGAASALSAFALERGALSHSLPATFAVAFVLLVIGTLLISNFRLTTRSLMYAVVAGLLFGAAAFAVKLAFLETSFIDGFFWTRMGNVAVAAGMLLLPGFYASIRHGFKTSRAHVHGAILFNKILAGIAFALILFAIHLGSAGIVNALSGLQFVFLIVFAYILGRLFPAIFHGEIRPHEFPHKIAGIVLVVCGVAVLFL